ncbi:uncharacterized protein LTR77_005853 [Saxophila tyrrhenica]|uniref:Aminoglycoside phosphotransferase domain-containing protein n=1 Tax=Saxophila tyrrhenica TaxID=1690608 RepID=A0AAV9PAE8_9PEZI|nr:hypothetical protein LTR77_005853 [Saxophila tyrrhenica]
MAARPATTCKDHSKPEGSHDLAINNTPLRRLFTRLAEETVGRLYKSDGLCTPISRNKIIKTGHRVRLTEAATIKFVGPSYILMERIRGEEIPAAWKRLGEDGRRKIFSQLKAMFEELRSLKPPPGTGAESCVGGRGYDCRIPRCPQFGPFKTIQDFHFWLREGFNLTDQPKPDNLDETEWADLEKTVAMHEGPFPPPVFTHGDLNPFNILVRGDEVVGIVDREFGGWYPHYWEYTSAWYGNLWRSEWQGLVDQFLETFPAELEMEITRNKWWGEW